MRPRSRSWPARVFILAVVSASILGCHVPGRPVSSRRDHQGHGGNHRRASEPSNFGLADSQDNRHPAMPAAADIDEAANSGAANSPLRVQLQPVGRKLAEAARRSDQTSIDFFFDTLTNPRPRSLHSADGHIYLSTGMFRVLDQQEDLAGVLAIEMAKAILEERSRNNEPVPASMPSTGPDDDFRLQALAAKNGHSGSASAHSEVDGLAQRLLADAGYRSVNLVAVRRKLTTPASRGNAGTSNASRSAN